MLHSARRTRGPGLRLSIEGAPIAASIVRFLSGNWTSIEFRFTLCPMKESMSTAAPEKSTEACRCPRPYRLGKRQEAMDQKRLQMLHAARQLLLERGFPSFTIEAVAREAGVTRQTVHNQFGSRTALLEALCDFAALDGGLERLPEAFGQADALAALEQFVE